MDTINTTILQMFTIFCASEVNKRQNSHQSQIWTLEATGLEGILRAEKGQEGIGAERANIL